MPTIYNTVKYNPARGGHTQGHLRDALLDAIDRYGDWEEGKPEPTVPVGYAEKPLTLTTICGLLWNCTDIMPSDACRSLGLRQGSTYARGARALLSMIKSSQSKAA
jgi:hypothetical protein